jgi:predicted nucleotidyltransferase
MPVKSFNSRVLKWPEKEEVHRSVETWAKQICEKFPGIVLVGYFGSYARDDWGVGSDLDVVMVVKGTVEDELKREAGLSLKGLPVPVDLLFYSAKEWRSMSNNTRFGKMIKTETIWVFGDEDNN